MNQKYHFNNHITLRPYQIECVDAVWNNMFKDRFSLFVGSTGLGKTVILSELIRKTLTLLPSAKICFIVNKLNLLKQTTKSLADYLKIEVSTYYGKEKDLSSNVIVASIQSCRTKIKDSFFNLIIFDEAHNVNQDDGNYKAFIDVMIKNNERVKFVGCTATPFRNDGLIYGPDKLFKDVCFSRGLKWSIDNGFLTRPSMKRVDHQFDTSKLRIKLGDFDSSDLSKLVDDVDKIKVQIEDAIPQLDGRKCIVWACINITHAELVYKMLNDIGEAASVIHSKQSLIEQEKNKSDFENGITRHLTFVTIVSEGYNYPKIDAVVFMRPTRSPNLYVQTCGRSLRLSEGKKDALILDYGRVVESCGPLDDPIISKGGKKKKYLNVKMKFCKSCYEYVEVKASVCPSCGSLFEKREMNLSNLTDRSYDNKSEKLVVELVYIRYFTSKNNNKCITIEYRFKRMFAPLVKEFFMLDKPWSMSKFRDRIKKLNISVVGNHYVGEFEPFTRTEVEVIKSGKYYKIL